MFRRESKLGQKRWPSSQRFTGKKFPSTKCSGALRGKFRRLSATAQKAGEAWTNPWICCYLGAISLHPPFESWMWIGTKAAKSERSCIFGKVLISSLDLQWEMCFISITRGKPNPPSGDFGKRGGSAWRFSSGNLKLSSSPRSPVWILICPSRSR